VEPELQCSERVQRLNLSIEAHRLDGATLVAAISPQLVDPETLAGLKNRKRPLTIPPEHDPEKLGEQALDEEHLHIIVQKLDTGKSCYLVVADERN
jgi:hypothetical protein